MLVYGGALHNDLAPNPELASYSFGPAIDAFTHGDYREIDLYVPELVATLPALRAERWYPVLAPDAHAPGTTLIRRQPGRRCWCSKTAGPRSRGRCTRRFQSRRRPSMRRRKLADHAASRRSRRRTRTSARIAVTSEPDT